MVIDHTYFSQSTMKSIENMKCLQELTITNAVAFIFPIKIKSVEKLHIKGDTYTTYEEIEFPIISNLPILKELTLTDLLLNQESIKPFSHIKINNLILNNIDLEFDVTISDLNHILKSTDKLTLLNSHTLFHQIILHNCFADTLNIHSLTFSLPKSSSDCYLDYSTISYSKKIKRIKIIIKLTNLKIY